MSDHTIRITDKKTFGVITEQLARILEAGNVRIVFRKADGSTRAMVATRRDRFDRPWRYNGSSVIRVWDVALGEYRSFCFTRLDVFESLQ